MPTITAGDQITVIVDQASGVTVPVPSTRTTVVVPAGEANSVDLIASGPQGPPGAGIPGAGVPAGGSDGQVLAKSSGTDYETEWITPATGGGSDLFGGATNAVPLTYTTSSLASGTWRGVKCSGWTFNKRASAQPGPTLVADNANFACGPTEAGWYQIRVNIYLGFNVGSLALPDHVRLEMSTYYDNYGVTQDIACTGPEPNTGFGSRMYHGCQACVVTHVFYTPSMGTDLNAGWQPAIYWPGDATLPSNGHTITLDVARMG